jgi:hypothetical protein
MEDSRLGRCRRVRAPQNSHALRSARCRAQLDALRGVWNKKRDAKGAKEKQKGREGKMSDGC